MPDEPPICLNCEYDLTGLPRQARCPECGIAFDLDDRARAIVKPLFGFWLLLVPALIVPPAFFVSYLTASIGGILLLLLFPIPILAAAVYLAAALGNWRIAKIRLRNDRVRLYGLAFALRFFGYVVIQVALAYAALIGSARLLDWLMFFGVVEYVGWS